MDAHSGELRGRMSLVQGIDRKIYDCSAKLDGICWSEVYDETFDYTFGRREGRPERGPNPRLLPEINTDVDDTYDLIEGVSDYLFQRFNRNGANGLGGTGNNSDTNHPFRRTVVNTYIDYGNGAICPYGAAYFRASSNIDLCKGVAVPDILSHEYFHSLNHHTANLENSAESGGLNEANSYILAECFEQSLTGATDWTDSTELAGFTSRYNFADPMNSVLSPGTPFLPADRLFSPHLVCSSDWDYNYNNAFVPGHAAYLLGHGDYFNGCTIRAIGVERLEQVWYRALVHYFVACETFNGAYAKLQQAAADLYPDDAHTRTQVRRAFQAVEMDQPGKCSGQPARVPQALDIQGW